MSPQFPSDRYTFSFTAASLRPEIARTIAEIRLSAGSWSESRARILSTNALQMRSPASARRLESEFRHRLTRLSEEQLILLVEAPAEARAALAWLAAMKQSRFLFDFAAMTLRDKLSTHDPLLRPSDYEGFIEERSASHPELMRLTTQSMSKVREVLMKMLREVGLLADRTSRGGPMGTIQRPVLAPAVHASIIADDPRWLAGFLVPDLEIAAL